MATAAVGRRKLGWLVMAHARKLGRRVVAAFITNALAQECTMEAQTQERQLADQLRSKAQ